MTRGSTMSVRTFTVEQLRFVCITDLDEGGMSVTNDVERVLASLVSTNELRAGDIVIYRDSEGTWDQIVTDHECRFLDFRLLNARTPHAAMIQFLKKGWNNAERAAWRTEA